MNSAQPSTKPHHQASARHQVESLVSILERAAAGDFRQSVPALPPGDELANLYAGVRDLLAAVQKKFDRLELMNSELEDMFVARTTELFGSETHFQAVADAAGDAIITTDHRGGVIYLNRAAELIFGQPLSAAVGHPLTDLIPDLGSSYLNQAPDSPTHPTKPPKLVAATATTAAGHRFPVEISFASWRGGGRTHYTTAIVRDLTVHQMLVDKLAQQAASLKEQVASQTKQLRVRLVEAERDKAEDEALLSSIGEAVVAVNKVGQIFFANQEFADLAGATLAQLKGRDYYSVIRVEDQAGHPLPRARRPVQRALFTGRRTFSNDYVCRTGTGAVIPIAITAAPIILKGTTIGAIDVLRDITREKEADRLKSEFVSLASHQLRTPATAVKGLLALLLEGYSGRLTRGQLTTLRQAFIENEHQLRLIDDMLDVAKLDAGEIVLDNQPVNIPELVRAVVKEQQEAIHLRHQTVTVKTAPQADQPIVADPLKLQMVFDNLLTNASKYTPEGGAIHITIQPTPGHLSVHVQDNGIGIASEDHASLFKRFSRAPNVAKVHTTGSGLGLYLAKKLVDLHHGRIDLVSRPGSGSTFTVVLPRPPKH